MSDISAELDSELNTIRRANAGMAQERAYIAAAQARRRGLVDQHGVTAARSQAPLASRDPETVPDPAETDPYWSVR